MVGSRSSQYVVVIIAAAGALAAGDASVVVGELEAGLKAPYLG